MAIAAACPTARTSVATAETTNITSRVKTSSNRATCRGVGRDCCPQVGCVPEQGEVHGTGGAGPQELGEHVGRYEGPREVAGEGEGHGDGRVDVRSGEVAHGLLESFCAQVYRIPFVYP
jgi:hypothetical protein